MAPRSRTFRYDPTKQAVVEAPKSGARCRPRYPIAVESLAVLPEQINEAREYDRRMGLATEYREDGSPLVEDSRHYKKYRKIHGHHFRNGYES